MNTPSVCKFFDNSNNLPIWEHRLLQDQHNVNVHASADECEDYLDADEDLDELTVMDEAEFFGTYCMSSDDL